MIPKTPLLQFLILLLVASATPTQTAPFDELLVGIRVFDDTATTAALDSVTAAAQAQPETYRAQWEAAEACRLRAAQLRDAANLDGTSSRARKALAKEQLALAKRGAPYAARALELAPDDAALSAAHRVVGELAAMEISGMISGIRKGPIAESNIEQALAIAPDDPENLRAAGVNFLYRPAFVGGDVEKAVSIFEDCHTRAPASETYCFLLAVAHARNGDDAEALAYARKVLEMNPEHRNARALLGDFDATP